MVYLDGCWRHFRQEDVRPNGMAMAKTPRHAAEDLAHSYPSRHNLWRPSGTGSSRAQLH